MTVDGSAGADLSALSQSDRRDLSRHPCLSLAGSFRSIATLFLGDRGAGAPVVLICIQLPKMDAFRLLELAKY